MSTRLLIVERDVGGQRHHAFMVRHARVSIGTPTVYLVSRGNAAVQFFDYRRAQGASPKFRLTGNANMQAHKPAHTDRQTGIQTDRQTDARTNRCTHKQMQTDKHAYKHSIRSLSTALELSQKDFV